jgi:hypothetical protein
LKRPLKMIILKQRHVSVRFIKDLIGLLDPSAPKRSIEDAVQDADYIPEGWFSLPTFG